MGRLQPAQKIEVVRCFVQGNAKVGYKISLTYLEESP